LRIQVLLFHFHQAVSDILARTIFEQAAELHDVSTAYDGDHHPTE
jgi:hypothetical protein